MDVLPSFLCGRWVNGGDQTAPLVDPTTGDEIVRISTTAVDTQPALAYARKHGSAALRGMNFAQRGQLLANIAARLAARRDAWNRTLLVNMGATARDTAMDIEGAIQTLRYYAGLGAALGAATMVIEPGQDILTRAGNEKGAHIWTPVGGVAIHINAFNFPSWGLWGKVAVAFLSGVPVLTKPGAATSLLAWEMVREVVPILPDGALSLLMASGRGLVDAAEPQDVIAFTGSDATARTLRSSPAILGGGVRLNIEADSLNSIVLGLDVRRDDPLFDRFCDEVAQETVIKSGQKCTAARRVLVPEAMVGSVTEALAARLANVVTGNPRNAAVELGPVVSRQQQVAIHQGIAALEEETVAAFVGLDTPVDADPQVGCFVPAHLLVCQDSRTARRIHEEEIFGPVATVIGYRDPADAAALVRRGRGSLIASVFSDDSAQGRKIVEAIAPWHGRVLFVDEAIAADHTGHGLVLPQSNHGGPGRAGGGEELGGLRGMRLYHQRTALQGSVSFLRDIGEQAAEATF
ncbi:MAG: 3,4-dehydroadipyl-CoA semialdehyde dehydrogenase [Rhodospirillales bacterium]|nr:3,4-dehydroadipyl-CoA semialdehyde dehydrogenase [Rhodospirillales bacterium]